MCEKKSRFSTRSRFISKKIQDRVIVTTECEQETVPKLRPVASVHVLNITAISDQYAIS